MAGIKKIDGGLERKQAVEASEDPMETLRTEDTYTIMIHVQEGPEGKFSVKMAVNGYALNIPRGQKVEIGESFMRNLEDAIYDIYTKDDDGNEVVTRVPRFAFNILSGPHSRPKDAVAPEKEPVE